MNKDKIHLNEEFPVKSPVLFNAWLDGNKHSAFTGGGPVSIRNVTGSNYTAWDGYISGKILELEEGKRILHTWRTSEFPENAEDSLLEILLEDTVKGCKLTLNHWNIPEGQVNDYKKGWVEFYFKPMKEYFKK